MRPGKPLVQGGPPKRRKAVRQVSVKRAAEQRAYTARGPSWFEEHPWCVPCVDGATVDGIVTGPNVTATERHHMRGRVGNDYLDETAWLSVCHAHHEHITGHYLWALTLGYSLSRNNIREDAA